MFHCTLLDPQLSPLHRSHRLHQIHLPLLRCSILRRFHPPPLCKGERRRFYCGRLAEQSPLTGYDAKSLVKIGAEHTFQLKYLRDGAVSTRTWTISRLLWMRLTHKTQQTWDR